MLNVRLEHPEVATAAEATATLGQVFPDAGTYVIADPAGMMKSVTFSDAPWLAEQPLPIWRELFPIPGAYAVGRPDEFAKAVPPGGPVAFPEWWLERLVGELRVRTVSARVVMQRAVEAYMAEHGGAATSPAALQGFETLLADLRAGVRFLVAEPLPPEIEQRVRALGFTDEDVLDFAGIAYRMGMLDVELHQKAKDWEPLDWGAALATTRTAAVTTADEIGIRVARHEVARYLTPVLLRDGQAAHGALLERERQLVQTLTIDAVREKLSARGLASQLFHQVQDELGTARDWERVARTELQRVRLLGAFGKQRQDQAWTATTELYRIPAANPCNACLRLYITPGGLPRLYTVAALEQFEAQGPNRGPAAEWTARIGPTHPNCLCSPWYEARPALRKLWAQRAGMWRQILRERKLPYEEAA